MRKSISSILRGSIQRKKMKGETKKSRWENLFPAFWQVWPRKAENSFFRILGLAGRPGRREGKCPSNWCVSRLCTGTCTGTDWYWHWYWYWYKHWHWYCQWYWHWYAMVLSNLIWNLIASSHPGGAVATQSTKLPQLVHVAGVLSFKSSEIHQNTLTSGGAHLHP